jgi:hypothetical protein
LQKQEVLSFKLVLLFAVTAKYDQYLNREIEKSDLENYATDLIGKYFFEWNDDVISDIIFQ